MLEKEGGPGDLLAEILANNKELEGAQSALYQGIENLLGLIEGLEIGGCNPIPPVLVERGRIVRAALDHAKRVVEENARSTKGRADRLERIIRRSF